MLKKRIITAVVLLALFILLLFTVSPPVFCVLTGVALLACAWEWNTLMGVTKFSHKARYLLFIACSMAAIFFVPISWVLLIALLWWVVAAFCIAYYVEKGHLGGKTLIRGTMGALVLVPCWLSLNVLRNTENGTHILLFLFVLIWAADSAAYFTGKRFGKHKMLPLVSPGKTWEGLTGALIVTAILVLLTLFILQIPYRVWPNVMALSLVTVLFSVVGDLFESMLKRQQGLKDSGQLLPGHGGLLDRIDSLTAAAPLFTLGILWMNK